jgi:hypothetical protein
MPSQTVLLICALTVFAFKIYLAWTTKGAPDISAWESFLQHIHDCGVCVYQTGGLMHESQGDRITPFNHPPFIIHCLRMLGYIATALRINFAVVFRTMTSIFDLGSAAVVYNLLQRYGVFTPTRFILYLFAPATIIISGFHGNTDTVMIFFVLLTAFLIEKPYLAGIAFGLALGIKIVAIIFAGVFFFYMSGANRLRFIGAAVVTAVILAMPFVAQDPILIGREVLGYGGFAGRWGWSRLLVSIIGLTDTFLLISRLAAYALLAWIFYLSFKLNRAKTPLLTSLSLIPFMFLSFTPSWGTNYMSWLDPFPLVVGAWPALLYYLTSGALLVYLYFINEDEHTRLIGVSWLGMLIVTLLLLRRSRKQQKLLEQPTDSS